MNKKNKKKEIDKKITKKNNRYKIIWVIKQPNVKKVKL